MNSTSSSGLVPENRRYLRFVLDVFAGEADRAERDMEQTLATEPDRLGLLHLRAAEAYADTAWSVRSRDPLRAARLASRGAELLAKAVARNPSLLSQTREQAMLPALHGLPKYQTLCETVGIGRGSIALWQMTTDFDSVALKPQIQSEHFAAARRLAASGLTPLAISAATLADGRARVCSLWRRPLPNAVVEAVALSRQSRNRAGAGKADELIGLYEKALAAWGRSPVPNHPLSVDVRESLAAALIEQKRHAEAIPLLRSVVEDRFRHSANDPEPYFQDLQRLGGALLSQQDLASAAREFVRLRDALRIVRGDNHADYRSTVRLIGTIYHRNNEPAKALAEFEKAVAAYARTDGPNHSETIDCLLRLAAAQRDAKKFDACEATYRDAARRADAGLGHDSPERDRVLTDLIAFNRSRGRGTDVAQDLADLHMSRLRPSGPRFSGHSRCLETAGSRRAVAGTLRSGSAALRRARRTPGEKKGQGQRDGNRIRDGPGCTGRRRMPAQGFRRCRATSAAALELESALIDKTDQRYILTLTCLARIHHDSGEPAMAQAVWRQVVAASDGQKVEDLKLRCLSRIGLGRALPWPTNGGPRRSRSCSSA